MTWYDPAVHRNILRACVCLLYSLSQSCAADRDPWEVIELFFKPDYSIFYLGTPRLQSDNVIHPGVN